MSRAEIDNLGVPPLAGLCSYDDATQPGLSVEENVALMRRYNYTEIQLNQIMAAHLPSVPEWEVKCGFSLHLWLDAEHSANLRKRVGEMRNPPLYLDQIPDPKLEAWLAEVIRAENTLELLVGIYQVVKAELVRVMKKHLQGTNRLIDHPTYRMLRIHVLEEEEMLNWGEAAISALVKTEADAQRAEGWEAHLRAYLLEAGGLDGELIRPEGQPLPAPLWDGEAFEMALEPRRDERFVDPFNQSAVIDDYYVDESRPFDERVLALMCKRIREMDVPEWMAPILFRTKGKPWAYYVDLSRQLWDEARHAMIGEVGLYREGVPFYKYPIDLKSSTTLNTSFEPLEAHTILWHIEQGLMPRKTGKQYEWAIAKGDGDALATSFQDYDWADEVLHVQIGRRWLTSEYKDAATMQAKGQKLMEQWQVVLEGTEARSKQEPWWHEFVAEVRANHAARAGDAIEQHVQELGVL